MKVKRPETFVNQPNAETKFPIDISQINQKMGLASMIGRPHSSHFTSGPHISEHRFLKITKSPRP
jgi:hypothetical protein